MSKRNRSHNTKRVSNTYRRTTFGNTPLYPTMEDFFEDVHPILNYIAKNRYTAIVNEMPEILPDVASAILEYGLIRYAGKYQVTPDPLTFTMRSVANLGTLLAVLNNEPMGSELDMYVYKCNQQKIDAYIGEDLLKEIYS